MALRSRIEWTEATWNPVTGCTKISPGCTHCYAERMARRLRAMEVWKYRNGFKVTLHPDTLDQPLHWRKPRMVFCCSMSDLFHRNVPPEFIYRVFGTMVRARQHTFQVLTKRSERMALLAPHLNWSNVWAGVTVENADYVWRIDHLRLVKAAPVRFLSLEPLLGPIRNLDLRGIDWVIVGGESGPGARPMKPEWVREIRDQCLIAGVPFFFKQWGGRRGHGGRELDGRTWEAYPRQ